MEWPGLQHIYVHPELPETKKQITILQDIVNRGNSGKEIENITKSFAKVLTDCTDT